MHIFIVSKNVQLKKYIIFGPTLNLSKDLKLDRDGGGGRGLLDEVVGSSHLPQVNGLLLLDRLLLQRPQSLSEHCHRCYFFGCLGLLKFSGYFRRLLADTVSSTVSLSVLAVRAPSSFITALMAQLLLS
jgi:hypothetical protein